jgi:hypothetical protein
MGQRQLSDRDVSRGRSHPLRCGIS